MYVVVTTKTANYATTDRYLENIKKFKKEVKI